MTQPQLPADRGWMGDPSRGAALGRADNTVAAGEAMRFCLRKLRINNGGYDEGGSYWGVGEPVYWACEDRLGRDQAEMFFRASDRADARAQVVARYPTARFYR